ncbi:MAG: YceD family protein [Woeseiaceae bacterium]
MGNPLQQRRTPEDFAANAEIIEISGKIGDFRQLAEIAEADLAALNADMIPAGWREHEVRGELRFDFLGAQDRLPALRGELTATIDAVCQRCLAPFELPLRSELRLLFGGETAIEKDGEEFEVWELEGDDMTVAELVEEALIMAIPFVPMHAGDKTCVAAGEADAAAEKMTLPFAELRAQMEKEK